MRAVASGILPASFPASCRQDHSLFLIPVRFFQRDPPLVQVLDIGDPAGVSYQRRQWLNLQTTTAVPEAIASSTGNPKPSMREG